VYSTTDGVYQATTATPLLKAGEFGFLKTKEVNEQGAFLDWGIPKDLFVPFAEQAHKMQPGKYYLVYLYIDEKNGRPLASSRAVKYLSHEAGEELQEQQEVDVLIFEETRLGLKVIVNNKYIGVVYHNDIFRPVKIGERTKAYIQRIREDKKIDLSLERSGAGRVEPGAEKILEKLRENGGFLELHDNTDPEKIRQVLHMSKKTFKKAIGGLYKQQIIRIEKNGIYLV
jgi:predicted RNA-binding protein (virulence factor B family)